MVRPKKGTKGGDIATEKWRKTMLEKYGGEEGVRKMLQRSGAKGGAASKFGGFACEKIGPDGLTGRERASIAGRKGGRISKRGKAKSKEE